MHRVEIHLLAAAPPLCKSSAAIDMILASYQWYRATTRQRRYSMGYHHGKQSKEAEQRASLHFAKASVANSASQQFAT